MDQELKEKLTSKNQWIRFFFMVIFAIVGYVVLMLMFVIAAAQFLMSLFKNKTNENLMDFGKNLGIYLHQIAQFLMYGTEEKPYPFTTWPDQK